MGEGFKPSGKDIGEPEPSEASVSYDPSAPEGGPSGEEVPPEKSLTPGSPQAQVAQSGEKEKRKTKGQILGEASKIPSERWDGMFSGDDHTGFKTDIGGHVVGVIKYPGQPSTYVEEIGHVDFYELWYDGTKVSEMGGLGALNPIQRLYRRLERSREGKSKAE